MKQSGGVGEPAAEDLEIRSRSDSNLSDTPTELGSEGDLQVKPVEQKIAKGGVRINEYIKKPSSMFFFMKVDEQNTVEIHLIKDQIKLDIYNNRNGYGKQLKIGFDTTIFDIMDTGSSIDIKKLQLIFEESEEGSPLLMGKHFTFIKDQRFNLKEAAEFLKLLFFDITPENYRAMKVLVKELQEKASNPIKEELPTQYSNIKVYVGGSS